MSQVMSSPSRPSTTVTEVPLQAHNGGAATATTGEMKADKKLDRIPLSAMTESDEVYERIDELENEITLATLRVKELDKQLKDLRDGLGDMNDLMDLKSLREVCNGRLLLLKNSLIDANKKLELISNSTRSLLVKALASLRTVMFHKLKYKQKQYDITRSERVKRERDETERRLISTTNALQMERKGQSQTDQELMTEYEQRVEWLVSGQTKNCLNNLNNSHFINPRGIDETKKIEKYLVSSRQQGTGNKMILILKHLQMNKNGVYTVNLNHNNLGKEKHIID
jgi:hypothetical protein